MSASQCDKSWIVALLPAPVQVQTERKVVRLTMPTPPALPNGLKAARANKGVVIVLNFGTGIGSAILDGRLSTTEFGHVPMLRALPSITV
jgi:hypothetical protein